jgi:protein phosphatase 1 regulatory subunit 37
MIEESKLAKTFRKDEDKKVESRSPRRLPESLIFSGGSQNEGDAIAQAQQCRDQLQELIARSTPSDKSPSETQADLELIERAKALLPTLAEVIGTCSDSARLDELLGLNDSLISLVVHASPKPRGKIQGLGIEVNGLVGPLTDIHGADKGSSFRDDHVITPRNNTKEDTDDDSLSTPRLDKGKGKAPQEPEIVEPVLSPRGFAVADSDEETEREAEHEGEDDPRSPTDL